MEAEEEDEEEEVIAAPATGGLFCPPFWQHAACWTTGFLRLTFDDCILALKDDWPVPLRSPLPKSAKEGDRK